ncbi:hypothetical protein DSCW_21190 [Desulfosarcina widdelii]|uniref:Uncharacterized protein n=1 Tax=Desulfosarcina widdelii TaxID=947919 RepID=A0A5K7YYD0_9BACT|nr:hypothetical protein [Desulfosarcina widdelii]BBO74702.1 hypothetical protein DSCW_21190 [Desulfosarcina widdelii]
MLTFTKRRCTADNSSSSRNKLIRGACIGAVPYIGEFVERLAQLQYDSPGGITVDTARRMLAVLKCLESALIAFLIKMKL